MYRIAINTMQLDSKLQPGDSRWARLNDSFINQEISLFDFANTVYMGQPFTSWHSGRRKDDNFICSQFVAVDLETHDNRSTIESVLGMEFVQVYGGFVYTTPSHTTTDPRCRVVFLLDQPITDSAAYEVAIGFVYSLFPGSDTACIDSSRFYYGSRNAELSLLNNVLPVDHMRSYYNRWRRVQPVVTRKTYTTTQQGMQRPLPPQQPGVLTPDMLLDYAVSDAAGQGRNNRGYRLARQLKELGLSQFEAEGVMRRYQQAVGRLGHHDYTESEALTNTKSAYSRTAGY